MAKDPVCGLAEEHEIIPVKFVYQGEPHFCYAEGCLEEFRADPDRCVYHEESCAQCTVIRNHLPRPITSQLINTYCQSFSLTQKSMSQSG